MIINNYCVPLSYFTDFYMDYSAAENEVFLSVVLK